MSATPAIAFFGAIGRPGHFWHGPKDTTLTRAEIRYLDHDLPNIDGGYVPQHDNRQGACAMNYVGGWTVLSWHDYTGARRRGANSNLCAHGNKKFTTMLKLLLDHYPEVAERQPGMQVVQFGAETYSAGENSELGRGRIDELIRAAMHAARP
jgi:hypothetical protein